MFPPICALTCLLVSLLHSLVSSARFSPFRPLPRARFSYLLGHHRQRLAVDLHMSGIRSNIRKAARKLDEKYNIVKTAKELDENYLQHVRPIEKVTWDARLFNPEQNTLFLDVDDTILSSGSNYVSGIDDITNQVSRNIPEEETTQSKCVYPRALEFINLISAGATDGEYHLTTGNVFVTTARPKNMAKKVKAKFENDLQRHEPDRLSREPVGYLWGHRIGGTLFAARIAEQRALDKVSEKARKARDKLSEKARKALHREREPTRQDPANRQHVKSLKPEFIKIGNVKFDRIKQQVLTILELHPQYRESGKFFFLGDDGQGDFYASIKLLQEGLVDFAFIHDVRNLKDVPKEDWAQLDGDAAGVELYESLPSELQNRIVLFRNYEEAIRHASSIIN